MQFFQFYLAATVLTVLPVAAQLDHRSRLHRALRSSEARYRLLAEQSTDVILHVDRAGRIRFISPSIEQWGGHQPSELVGRDVSVLVAPEHITRMRESLALTAASSGASTSCDYLAMRRDGTRSWCETNSRAIVDDDGRIDGILSIVRDISARKMIEQQLAEAAMTDPLTGLPNRRAFRAVIDRRVDAGLARHDCLALFDIDHFKRVNDAHGHDAGDEVLRSFARAAQRWIRDGDFVARFGGEEFAVLLPDTKLEEAMVICDRFRTEMAAVVTEVATGDVRVTVSGGVGAVATGGIDQALKQADAALYRAKQLGRDQLAIAA
jgi:diguanylate cyclase (GGDEF)-like protein/PAS domain S-box-containing protein